MSGYLLDTSAWLCAYHEPERLSARTRRMIQQNEWLGLASISLWEVAMNVSIGKLPLPIPLDEWFQAALPRKIRILDLSPARGFVVLFFPQIIRVLWRPFAVKNEITADH